MNEQFATANGLRLCYETFGAATDPPMLLIMGLGTQMIQWDAEFCEMLAGRGFFVIRYDNRDVGRSERIEGHDISLLDLLSGKQIDPPYLLADMASDAAGLLDALGLDAAHIVGVSMGGMIAQSLAIDHPERVLSLCSIMSTTGDRTVGEATPDALAALSKPIGQDREAVAESAVEIWRTIGSPDYPVDEDLVRARGRLAFDRGMSPDGYVRQLAAILASPDRTTALGRVDVPTLVIHGRADPLVGVSGGEATAAAIRGARLELFDGMGHDIPRQLWGRFAELISENAARALAAAD